jgi:hypothetical protein
MKMNSKEEGNIYFAAGSKSNAYWMYKTTTSSDDFGIILSGG